MVFLRVDDPRIKLVATGSDYLAGNGVASWKH